MFFPVPVLTVLVTTALAMPASAFDFLGDMMATIPQKYVPPSPPSGCASEDYIEHVDGYLVCRG